MEKDIKKPQIRFQGFTEEWKQRKLGELVNDLKSGLSRMLSSEDIGVPVVRANNVEDNKLNMNKDVKYWYRNDPQGADVNNYLIEKDDILINFINSESKMGTAAIVENNLIRDTIYTTNILKMKVSEELNNYFFLAYSNTEKYKYFIKSISKIAVNQSSFTTVDFKNHDILIPCEDEQGKIATFFKQLDNLITLHQRKYDSLIKVKKSMLEKMFPRSGAKKPEIRFAGFTDDWEQRKFLDITFLAGEKNKDNLSYESYSVSNEKGFIPQNEQFENGGTMKEADKTMYYIVKPNSFVYNPARINVGSIAYSDLKKNVIVSSLYEVFQTVDDVDDRFLWHWFKTNTFQRMIEQFQEGGVRLYFYYDKLCMGSIMMPIFEEQRKIGQCLDKLDNLISLHQCKLNLLKNIKKAMLEKMFV